MKKNDSLNQYDVVVPSTKNNVKKGKSTSTKVSKPKKSSKPNIIEDEDVVFSRTKKNNYRPKDRKLETLIEEINKNNHVVLEEETLDLPKKEPVLEEETLDFPPREMNIEEDTLNISKEEDEEVLEFSNEKKVFVNPETMVLPNYNREIKRKDKRVFENPETMVLPNYNKEIKELERKVERQEIAPKTVKKKKKRYRIRKRAILLVLFILLLIVGGIVALVLRHNHLKKLEEERIRKENYIKEVNSHYSNLVRANKDTTLYKKVNNNYQVAGMLYKDNVINIKKEDYDENTKYFYSEDMDLYVGYADVDPNQEEIVKDDRYKKYIPFNENVVTNEEYIIYHQDDSKYYKLTESKEYPIIIKMSDKYYFEFKDELVYVIKDDVKETKKSENTKLTPVSSIPVLNYHHIYDPKERTCNQSICMTTTRFTEHIKYFKDNNILDLTMKEFEMFMNNQIRLPKSVLVTLDDGWLRQNAIKILDEQEFHATYFLVTSWYLPIESKYVEYHSHSHNMHNQGECKTGQGGGIQCLSEKKIQEDLKKSREILNNTTYFCYPFYEWNDYAINQLKKAGFTLAFIGGQRAAKPSDNHYRIPRYVIYSWTTTSNLKQYFK